MWKTTTAAVGILLASRAAPAQAAVPAAPEDLKVFARNGAVILKWTDPSDSTITKYQYTVIPSRVSRVPAADGSPLEWTDISNSGPTTTSYKFSNLRNGIIYYFYIRAVNNEDNGAISSQASETPESFREPAVIVSRLRENIGNIFYVQEDKSS